MLMPIINHENCFPCPNAIPFDMLCDIQAHVNHNQSLVELNNNGGITALECLAIVEQLNLHQVGAIGEQDAGRMLFNRFLLVFENKSLNKEL